MPAVIHERTVRADDLVMKPALQVKFDIIFSGEGFHAGFKPLIAGAKLADRGANLFVVHVIFSGLLIEIIP